MHVDGCSETEKNYLIRRALNYALWTFENYRNVKTAFIEKANKSAFEMLRTVRNTKIETHCLFVYWILHEILFNVKDVEASRIACGIDNIKKIAIFFNIEELGGVVQQHTDTEEQLVTFPM